jgi:uncharacterized protein YutE (UPF0331/DUF86 family)
MTPEILEIVCESEVKTIMNVKTEDELNKLKNFRNLVAHGNYIILKDEDIRRLKKINERIHGYIRSLEQT